MPSPSVSNADRITALDRASGRRTLSDIEIRELNLRRSVNTYRVRMEEAEVVLDRARDRALSEECSRVRLLHRRYTQADRNYGRARDRLWEFEREQERAQELADRQSRGMRSTRRLRQMMMQNLQTAPNPPERPGTMHSCCHDDWIHSAYRRLGDFLVFTYCTGCGTIMSSQVLEEDLEPAGNGTVCQHRWSAPRDEGNGCLACRESADTYPSEPCNHFAHTWTRHENAGGEPWLSCNGCNGFVRQIRE